MMRNRLRTRWLWGVLVILLAMAGAACGSGDSVDDGERATATAETSPTADGTPAPSGQIVTPEDVLRKEASATKQGEVTWGFMVEDSGPLEGFGEPVGDGVLMAVEEINAAGGFQVGDTVYTIKLIRHDTKSDVASTVAVTTQLVRDDQVNVIWGPAAIGDPEAIQITQANEVLHLCPCPDRELTSLSTEEKAHGDFRWAFQTLPAPSQFLPVGAFDTARDHPEYDTFATICVNSEAGHAFCRFFKDAYEAAGFEHTGEEVFPPGTSDFSPFLTKLREGNPDIILNFTDAGVAQFSLLRQSWELDLGEFYIAVALPYDLFESLVGAGIREKRVSAGAAPRTHAIYTSEKARQFFEEKYRPYKGGSLPPAAFAALLTYDPVYMLVAAMQQAGTVDDTTKIAEALEQLHFAGVGEDDMSFDERHTLVTGVDACAVYQGEMTCSHRPPPE